MCRAPARWRGVGSESTRPLAVDAAPRRGPSAPRSGQRGLLPCAAYARGVSEASPLSGTAPRGEGRDPRARPASARDPLAPRPPRPRPSPAPLPLLRLLRGSSFGSSSSPNVMYFVTFSPARQIARASPPRAAPPCRPGRRWGQRLHPYVLRPLARPVPGRHSGRTELSHITTDMSTQGALPPGNLWRLPPSLRTGAEGRAGSTRPHAAPR